MVTKDLALQFALILSSGVPQLEAAQYVRPDLEGQDLKFELTHLLKDPNVSAAILHIQGKPWQEMSLSDRIQFAINKNYTEMAYFLYANNYNDLQGADRTKADVCRATLEAKLAGMAGKMGALESFWADVQSGKVKLINQSNPGLTAHASSSRN